MTILAGSFRGLTRLGFYAGGPVNHRAFAHSSSYPDASSVRSRLPGQSQPARQAELRLVRTLEEIQAGLNLRKTVSYEGKDRGALQKSTDRPPEPDATAAGHASQAAFAGQNSFGFCAFECSVGSHFRVAPSQGCNLSFPASRPQ
jgi:hypothetical protein